MEWINRLNRAMNYIEEHLSEELDYQEIAKIACCSTYNFQRMFSYIADMPLSEYIRRRRMTKAVVDLIDNNEKVIDVALKYGYNSPTAFNRAFKNVHGIAPSQTRSNGVSLKAFPPISFKIMIKGDVELNYRIEKKEAFRILGISETISKDLEENFQNIPQMWQKAAMNGSIDKIVALMAGEPSGMLGISACNEQEDSKYFIAVASDKPVCDPFEEYFIPASTWAVFPGEGPVPASFIDLEKRIITEWLPTSGYEFGNAPHIEVYLTRDKDKAKFEVWIPVVKGDS